MRLYVNPKDLTDKRKRYYIRSTSKFGAKLMIDIIGKENRYFKVIVSVDGNKQFFSFLKKNGVKLTKRPTPVLMAKEVLAELHVDPTEGVVVGQNKLGLPISIPISRFVGTNSRSFAVFISRLEPTLWLDFTGSNWALYCGFEEFAGLPLKLGISRVHDVAGVISKYLSVAYEEALSALTSKNIFEDEEVGLAMPTAIRELYSWRIVDPESKPTNKIYVDFGGLPRTFENLAIRIADIIWDDLIVLEMPRHGEFFVGRRKRKIIITEDPQDANFDVVVLRNKIIWNIRLKNKVVSVEEEYKALWEDMENE